MLVHDQRCTTHWRTLRQIGTAVMVLALAILAGVFLQRATGFVSPLLDSTPKRPDQVVASSALPVLSIRLSPDQLQQMQRAERTMREQGMGLSAELAPLAGAIQDGVQELPITLRVDCSWRDQVRRQCSYRIDVRDARYLGLKSFELSLPDAETWDNNWLRLQHLQREQIVALEAMFVEVRINDLAPKVMQLYERLTDDVLLRHKRENCQLVELPLIELPLIELPRTELARASDLPVDQADDRADVPPVAAIVGPPLAQQDPLLQQVQAVLSGQRRAAELFDVEKLGRFLAITELWSVQHAVDLHRIRFLWDHRRGLLEPIAVPARAPRAADNRVYVTEHPWLQRLMRDDQLSAVYAGELNRIVADDYTSILRRDLDERWRNVAARFQQQSPDFQPRTWTNLDARRQMLRAVLDVNDLVYGHFWPIDTVSVASDSPPAKEAGYWLQNAMKVPVELIALRVNGKMDVPVMQGKRPRLLYPRDWLEATRDAAGELPIASGELESVEAVCRIWGLSQTCSVPLVRWSALKLHETGLPEMPELSEALGRYPFLQAESTTRTLTIKPGTWDVAGDLLVPRGWSLCSGGGVTLRFKPGAVLLTSSPIQLIGGPSAPIRLIATGGQWSGVVVLRAGEESRWQHVQVEATTGIERPGWALTGGVTFYKSPIHLSHCRFSENHGEDALNVFDTSFRFERCEFSDSVSDAFDGDFVQGQIIDCQFQRIGGDAIDVSGSEVQVQRVSIRHARDKGISAGENSQVVAEQVRVDGAKMAVCSKDRSRVQIRQLTVERATYALAAYVKKPEYGPATLDAASVTLRQGKLHLAQIGSKIRIDGHAVPAESVDVQQLYAEPKATGDVDHGR
jgi:hypothetical protein